jgi:hypothetical protein
MLPTMSILYYVWHNCEREIREFDNLDQAEAKIQNLIEKMLEDLSESSTSCSFASRFIEEIFETTTGTIIIIFFEYNNMHVCILLLFRVIHFMLENYRHTNNS